MPILVQKAGWFRDLGSNGPVPSYEVEVRPPTLPKLLTLQCVRAVTALLHPRCTASFAGEGYWWFTERTGSKQSRSIFQYECVGGKTRGLERFPACPRQGGDFDLTCHVFCDLKPSFIYLVLVCFPGRFGWAARFVLERCCQCCLCTKGFSTKINMGCCLFVSSPSTFF